MITIHPLFWFVVATGILTGHFWKLMLLFMIVTCHELGHYMMARHFSWRIRKLTLLPFGGVMEVDEHGNQPMIEEALVTVAGPVQHIWMIALSFGMGSLFSWWLSFHELFVILNLMLLGFNLLPIWPLDGGKLLFLILGRGRSYKRAHRLLIISSLMFLIVFLSVSLYMEGFHLNLLFIITFLLMAHYTEWKHHPYVQLRFALERYTKWKALTLKKTKTLSIKETMTLDDVLKLLGKGVQHRFLVNDQLIGEQDVLQQYFGEKKAGYTVGDVFCIN